MVADLEFSDRDGMVVASMEHSEWVLDASLREAFARRRLEGIVVSTTERA